MCVCVFNYIFVYTYRKNNRFQKNPSGRTQIYEYAPPPQLAAGHFLRIRQWGGHLQKGTILYRVWRNDRWFVGNKKFGVVSHLLVGGGDGSGGILPQKIFVFFYPYDCNSLHFLKQIFGYTALHYAVDRLTWPSLREPA